MIRINSLKGILPMIRGLSETNSFFKEGTIYYDILFHVLTPAHETIKMYINVEAQNKFISVKYIISRAIFYVARLISAQMDRDFKAPEIVKTAGENDELKLHRLLETILSNTTTPEEKDSILESEYEIESGTFERGLQEMCDLSDAVEERGIEKGITIGKIETLSEFGLTVPEIAKKLELSEEEVLRILKK